MTADTPVSPELAWEPITEGIELEITEWGEDPKVMRLPMSSVNELRFDMEEAHFLARGLEKVECEALDVHDEDWIVLMGNSYKVKNVLQGTSRYAGENYSIAVLQFEYSEFFPEQTEVCIPGSTLISVYRPVS